MSIYPHLTTPSVSAYILPLLSLHEHINTWHCITCTRKALFVITWVVDYSHVHSQCIHIHKSTEFKRMSITMNILDFSIEYRKLFILWSYDDIAILWKKSYTIQLLGIVCTPAYIPWCHGLTVPLIRSWVRSICTVIAWVCCSRA